MKILVCGGRDYDDYGAVFRALADQQNVECIIEGGASGADQLARRFAMQHGVPVMEFPALWPWHGQQAGPIRNASMLRFGNPDLVIAFPGGKGTADMVRRAKKALVPVVEVPA